MVQIDIPLSAAIGATLAAAAQGPLRGEPRLWTNGYLAATVAFTAFFVVPALLFFLAGWPAWDTMYWFDREDLPAILPPLFVLLAMASSALGFVAVHALLRAGRRRAALALPVLLCLPAVIITLAGYRRVLHVGTTATFAADGAPNLLTSDLVWALALVVPLGVGAPLAFLVLRWAQRGHSAATK